MPRRFPDRMSPATSIPDTPSRHPCKTRLRTLNQSSRCPLGELGASLRILWNRYFLRTEFELLKSHHTKTLRPHILLNTTVKIRRSRLLQSWLLSTSIRLNCNVTAKPVVFVNILTLSVFSRLLKVRVRRNRSMQRYKHRNNASLRCSERHTSTHHTDRARWRKLRSTRIS